MKTSTRVALASLARGSADLAKAFDLAHDRETAIRKQLPPLEHPVSINDDSDEASGPSITNAQFSTLNSVGRLN